MDGTSGPAQHQCKISPKINCVIRRQISEEKLTAVCRVDIVTALPPCKKNENPSNNPTFVHSAPHMRPPQFQCMQTVISASHNLAHEHLTKLVVVTTFSAIANSPSPPSFNAVRMFSSHLLDFNSRTSFTNDGPRLLSTRGAAFAFGFLQK